MQKYVRTAGARTQAVSVGTCDSTPGLNSGLFSVVSQDNNSRSVQSEPVDGARCMQELLPWLYLGGNEMSPQHIISILCPRCNYHSLRVRKFHKHVQTDTYYSLTSTLVMLPASFFKPPQPHVLCSVQFLLKYALLFLCKCHVSRFQRTLTIRSSPLRCTA